MPPSRILGVRGANLPTRKSLSVVAADFLVGGLIGRFERRYDRSFEITTPEQAQEIFGDHVIASYFGFDALNGYFANVAGVNARIFVAAHVGFDGTVIDAVTATVNLVDSGPVNTLRLDAAYREDLEFGVSGNRTGYQIEQGARFSTKIAAPAPTVGVFTATLDSVAGIRLGDVVHVDTALTIEKHKVTAIDESAKTITWTDVAWGAVAGIVGNTSEVLGFRIRTYRQALNGVTAEVETDLGQVFCSMEPEVADFYVQNVHSQNRFLKATDLTSATLPDSRPTDVSVTTFLTAGADGTEPTTAAHWSRTLDKFDANPIRFLANSDSTVAAVQSAGETKLRARQDTPKWLFNVPSNQSKTQLLDIGHSFQRSDDVLGVLVANHLKVEDPFASSAIAPPREVPNVGHVMGLWIRVVGLRGIHFVPAVKDAPLFGLVGVVGDQFTSDQDRTDLADAGVNVVQEIAGFGTIVRNFRTLSTALEFRFANGILMRDFIKVSAVDSLQLSENTPNSLERIQADKMAILQFLYRLWSAGSTGSGRTGETFGQGLDADGNPTRPRDHFQVIADATNNPQTALNAGQRTLDVFFTFPAPAESIQIGVGILLRSADASAAAA